jgi:GH15 family glucan-1,4-alpha-glucosidase
VSDLELGSHVRSVEVTYPSIGDYAAIGNCRAIALVSRAGAIEWLCLPYFSSPSWFAAILDREKGGSLSVTARAPVHTERAYIDGTNVLETTFRCDGGVVRLTDFMTVGGAPAPLLEPQHELIRRIECVEGEVTIDVACTPRPRYGATQPRLSQRGRLGWACRSGGDVSFISSDLDLAQTDTGTLRTTERMKCGEVHYVVLSYCRNDVAVLNPLDRTIDERLDATVTWWRDWSSRCQYRGPYRDAVVRSALALKLLTFCLSGAIIAAATTSLPEGESGDRNWDYRYCWLRDTSLVLQAFLDLGYTTESAAFLDWLLHETRLTRPRLQVLYDLFGESRLDERELRYLEGYRGIGPVRVGNAAHTQAQHDVYGEVILTADSFVRRGGVLTRGEQKLLAGFGRIVCDIWRQPDHGIWEIRLPPRHNTHSKLMCWVALDRLLDLRERIGLRIDEPAVRTQREAIRQDIEKHAYDVQRASYTGYYGGDAPDAALLLLARYGFVEAGDARMIGTCRYIERALAVDGMLYRYPPGAGYDGVPGAEHLFAICTFWLVDYLARAGELDRARTLFERTLVCANDVGLFAEELDVTTKAPMGNFPQAFTHVGLITAALALEQAEQGRRGKGIAA